MTEPRAFDATTLPRHPRHGRAPVYWGVVLLVVIEAIVFLSMITSYFYLAVVRGGAFPHGGTEPPDLTMSALALGMSALALAPVHLAERAARRSRMVTMRIALAITALLGGGYVVLSILDLRDRTYLWSSHAYGSIVWTLSTYQALHVALALAGAAALFGFSFPHRYDGDRRAPVRALATYWDFVVMAGALSFFTLYISPRLA